MFAFIVQIYVSLEFDIDLHIAFLIWASDIIRHWESDHFETWQLSTQQWYTWSSIQQYTKHHLLSPDTPY